MAQPRKPRLAVFKFASCDGCQLSLLDCEDELLAGDLEYQDFKRLPREDEAVKDNNALVQRLRVVDGKIKEEKR